MIKLKDIVKAILKEQSTSDHDDTKLLNKIEGLVNGKKLTVHARRKLADYATSAYRQRKEDDDYAFAADALGDVLEAGTYEALKDAWNNGGGAIQYGTGYQDYNSLLKHINQDTGKPF
jgi:hypothetical protein